LKDLRDRRIVLLMERDTAPLDPSAMWLIPVTFALECNAMWMSLCCGPPPETDRGDCKGQLPVPDAFQHEYDCDLFA
jgi:hypothetical protein